MATDQNSSAWSLLGEKVNKRDATGSGGSEEQTTMGRMLIRSLASNLGWRIGWNKVML